MSNTKYWNPLPADTYSDNSLLTGIHSNSYAKGVPAAFEEGVRSTLPFRAYQRYLDSKTEKFIAYDAFLSSDEAKESPYYREGINVEQGISEHALRQLSEQHDADAKRRYWISQMPSGITGSVLKYGAIIAGNASDPATGALALAAPELVGIRAAATLARITNPAMRRLAYIGVGGIEGGIISTPQVVADVLGESKYQPQEDVFADVMATYMLGAGLGGLVRGVVGVKEPISKTAARMAKQTSISQLNEGYFPFVDDIVQQGYAEAREMDVIPERLPEKGALDLEKKLQSTQEKRLKLEQVAIASKAFEKETAHKTLPAIVYDHLKDIKSPVDNIPKPESLRIESGELPLYFREATRILRKYPEYRTKEDVELLKKIIYTDEEKLAKSYLKTAQAAKKNAESDMEEAIHKREVMAIQNRLKSIRAGKAALGENIKLKQSIDALLLNEIDIAEQLRTEEAYKALEPGTGVPVTREQLLASYEKSRDGTQSITVNKKHVDTINDIIKKLPENNEESATVIESDFKQLPENYTQGADEVIKALNKKSSVKMKALQNAVKCLGGTNG